MKPNPTIDARAERLFLGVCMHHPTRLEDRHLSPTLFAVERAAFVALRRAHGLGSLAGDLPTATTALTGVWTAAETATSYLDSEELLVGPLKKHLTGLAHRRQAYDLATALHRVADAPTNPLDDRETLTTLGAAVADLGQNGARPYRHVDTIAPEQVFWLWRRRIPLGNLTILDGDPGLGKTALTLDLAARLSSGRPLPDDDRIASPTGVVLINAEDGLADTIRPRLDAAGADCRQIVAFDLQHLPILPRDVPLLREAIRDIAASLVVIDPIMGLIAAAFDAYRDQDVRLVLNPLTALAQETGCAILPVRHLTKSPGPKALYRGSGSIAFAAAARSLLVLGEDPDAPETHRILACPKHNLCPTPASPRFAPHSSGPPFHLAIAGLSSL